MNKENLSGEAHITIRKEKIKNTVKRSNPPKLISKFRQLQSRSQWDWHWNLIKWFKSSSVRFNVSKYLQNFKCEKLSVAGVKIYPKSIVVKTSLSNSGDKIKVMCMVYYLSLYLPLKVKLHEERRVLFFTDVAPVFRKCLAHKYLLDEWINKALQWSSQ